MQKGKDTKSAKLKAAKKVLIQRLSIFIRDCATSTQ